MVDLPARSDPKSTKVCCSRLCCTEMGTSLRMENNWLILLNYKFKVPFPGLPGLR